MSAQGWIARHGSTHSRSMHASLLGQSLSSLHLSSGGGGIGVHLIPYGSPVYPGMQVQIPLWFRGEQSAFSAQSQGSTHFSFRQALVVWQSGSIKHSYGVQITYGFPLCCGKHVHLALWFLTLHSAFWPHCSNGQGSWHSRFIQACVNGHSESLLQPATERENIVRKNCLQKYSCQHFRNSTFYMLTFFANGVRIPFISEYTNTKRSMSFHLTFGVDATGMGLTRILTLFSNACKMLWAFRICCTFRSWC